MNSDGSMRKFNKQEAIQKIKEVTARVAVVAMAPPRKLPEELPVGARLRLISGKCYVAITPAKLTAGTNYVADWKCEDTGVIERGAWTGSDTIVWEELVEETPAEAASEKQSDLPVPLCTFCGDRFASRPEFDGSPEVGMHTMCKTVVDARTAQLAALAAIVICTSCNAPFKKHNYGSGKRCLYCLVR